MMWMTQSRLFTIKLFLVAEDVGRTLILMLHSSIMGTGGDVIYAILQTMSLKRLTGILRHRKVLIDGNDLS